MPRFILEEPDVALDLKGSSRPLSASGQALETFFHAKLSHVDVNAERVTCISRFHSKAAGPLRRADFLLARPQRSLKFLGELEGEMIARYLYSDAIGPDDLAMLQEVLQEAKCDHVPSEAADDVASQLIELYKRGCAITAGFWR